MTTVTAIRGRRAAGRSLKSPLAVQGDLAAYGAAPSPDASAPSGGVATTDRAVTLAEFEDYLRTANSRDGRPLQEGTINAYVSPGKNLDAWLAARNVDGDFTAVDSATLNRYFREYYLAHGQGGTHTLQPDSGLGKVVQASGPDATIGSC